MLRKDPQTSPGSTGYEILAHTADVGVRAWGPDLKQAFSEAALGMFAVMLDPTSIRCSQTVAIAVEAYDVASLLVEWLSELLYYFDGQNFVFSRFEIDRLTEKALSGRAFGERVDRRRHRFRNAIKAVTAHQVSVQHNGHWTIEVYFDI